MAFKIKSKKNKVEMQQQEVVATEKDSLSFDKIVEKSQNTKLGYTFLRIDKDIVDRIYDSEYFDTDIANSIPNIVNLAHNSDKRFIVNNDRKQSKGKIVNIKLSDDFLKMFNDKKREQLFTISLNNYVNQLVEWELNGNPEVEEVSEILTYEEQLSRVAQHATSLILATKGLKKSELVKMLEMPVSTISRLKTFKLNATSRYIDKLNSVFDDLTIDVAKNRVVLVNDGEESIYNFNKFLNYKPSHNA
ncbi:hypothetical protein [Vibrio owensii]|uniref:hypothetical protein n=1 Tax=Vibrio owensii TaxID=696485 RepID=UPI00215BE027|nr:hypothetical protein [Vibrio owensii]MCR9943900.1 hypothetical protein [Vibrio owensii]